MRGGFDGTLFVGACDCGAELQLLLPERIYRIEDLLRGLIQLGNCESCGRRYLLELGIVRSVTDVGS